MRVFSTIAQALSWLQAQGCTRLCADSRQTSAGDAFIAWPGAATDGRQYVQAALEQGANACLIEAQGLAHFNDKPWIQSDKVAAFAHLKAGTAPLAAAFYRHPSRQLDLVAVTGTNGKTSTAWWFASVIAQLAATDPRSVLRCAVVGTLGIGEPPALVPNGLTTPDPVLLQAELARLLHEGFTHCAIEASSIGLQENRLDGTTIKVAIFTNFTQDHLDYHNDLQAYWLAKRALFDWPGLEHAVINLDDTQGLVLYDELKGSALDLWSISVQSPARLRAQNLHNHADGMCFDVVELTPHGPQTVQVNCPIVGQFNVTNLLGVMAALRALGFSLPAIASACKGIAPVPGRMELIRHPHHATVVVDYAHTPDALTKTLAALRPATQASQGQLWCVFGCGGNRDASKRPLMARAVEQGADRIIVTSDNPRHEDPEAIIVDIDQGFSPDTTRQLIVDRKLAIQTAIAAATPQDIVLLAGKGHEPYQEIKGERLPYSDITTSQDAHANTGAHLLTCEQVARALAGSTLAGHARTAIRHVRTDSRAIRPGDLFVALKGENFDGHEFVQLAAQKGAVAALVSTVQPQCPVPQIVVADTHLALGQLARHWRNQFTIPVIGVTGSNGKTTVTQMVASILRVAHGSHALATQGNLNNDIGVPLTVLELRDHHVRAVFEMGMNHPGEIAYLAAIAAPTVALVNNAQREHLEFMHTVENVAIENGACLQTLPDDGIAVFPSDDTYTPLWRERAGSRKCLTFALQEPAHSAYATDIFTTSTQWQNDHWAVQATTPLGSCEFTLAIAGLHNVKNALAALACALAAGLSPTVAASGLSQFVPVKGRSRSFSLAWGTKQLSVVDDTYNANPDSMKAAVEVLAQLPSPRLLVIGDMGEVGDQGPSFHTELGLYAKNSGIDYLMCTGALSTHSAVAFETGQHFADIQALCNAVLARASEVSSILVKGSRFMKMEQVIAALQAAALEQKGSYHVA